MADAVVRCVPGGRGGGERPNVEACNGFFVACFVRNVQREPIDNNKKEEKGEGLAGRSANTPQQKKPN